jgi:hypothetical protein
MSTSIVPWLEYSAGQAEDLIAAVLIRTVQGAQRIDGAGGDDGVDVRAPADGGYEVYEIKSFHQRLTAGQKRQVSQSLLTAIRRQAGMVGWTLVLPLDFSPAEDRWFTGQLAASTEIPLSWIGRTQLEAELSRHRDLLRAFAPGSTERRAMDLLGTYNAERAGLAEGMADGIPRLVSLKEQLDVIDPDWAFDVEVAGAGVGVRLRPKDPDAPRRRPIGVTLAVDPAGDADVAETMDKFLKYGRPGTIPGDRVSALAVDLPGNLNQVIAGSKLSSVGFGPGEQDDSWQHSQRIEAIRDGRVQAVLPVEWAERSAGPMGGGWLSGRDRSGFLELAMRVEPDRTAGGIEIRAPASEDVLPEDVAPVLRFLSLLMPGDELRMVAPGTAPVLMKVTGPLTGDPQAVAAGADVAEMLARVQIATGARFPLPARWTQQEHEQLHFYDQLLTHGHVRWYWPGYALSLPALRLAKLLEESALPRLTMTGQGGDDPEVQLMGGTIAMPGKITCEVTGILVMTPRSLRLQLRNAGPLAMLPVLLGQDDRTRTAFYLAREEKSQASGSEPDSAQHQENPVQERG